MTRHSGSERVDTEELRLKRMTGRVPTGDVTGSFIGSMVIGHKTAAGGRGIAGDGDDDDEDANDAGECARDPAAPLSPRRASPPPASTASLDDEVSRSRRFLSPFAAAGRSVSSTVSPRVAESRSRRVIRACSPATYPAENPILYAPGGTGRRRASPLLFIKKILIFLRVTRALQGQRRIVF